jgi:hypothetical protein
MMTVKRFKWLVVALLVLLVLFLIGPPAALASGDDDDGATATASAGADASASAGAEAIANVTGGDLIGGDVIGGDTSISTGSNRAYAFSHSLGDVDINEGQNCMGSEQWGTFVVSRQTNELNPWCAALFYELNGKHEMRCDIKEISNKYLTVEECWLDQELTPVTDAPELAELYDQAARYEEHQVIEDEHDEELEVVQMQQQQILEQLASYEERLAQRPEPVIVQQVSARRTRSALGSTFSKPKDGQKMNDTTGKPKLADLIREFKILIVALAAVFSAVSVVGYLILDWRVSVNVATALAAQDLGTDTKIVSMDAGIADNKRTGEENAEDIADNERRVEQAFAVLLGRDPDNP